MKKPAFYKIMAALALAGAALLPAETSALNPDPDSYITPDRFFACYLPNTVGKGRLLFTVDHRAAEPAFDNPLEDGFGLDAGAFKIGLGLRYGLLDNFDVGFRRANNIWETYDTYEWDARYQLQWEEKLGVDLSMTGGFTWFYIPDAEDASGFGLGLLLGKTLSRRIYLSTGFLSHTNSSYANGMAAPPMGKTDSADVFSVALPVGLNVTLKKGLSLTAEGALPFSGYSAGYPSWAAGLKIETLQHTFSLFLTTTQYFTADGFVCGSDRGANPVLGFLITRQSGK